MCEICHSNPCLRGCPNEDEPKGVMRCNKCGNWLYEGEEYIIYNGNDICLDCIDEMNAKEILSMFGIKTKEAQAEEQLC